jgi:HEAT repeat protein
MEEAPTAEAVTLAGHRGDENTARAGFSAPDPAVRTAALGALERLGCLADSDLDTALGDPDGAVRRRAVELAAHRPAGSVVLVSLLADADPRVVEAAAWASGEQADPRAETVAALSRLATDHDDPLCRESAVAALGAIGAPEGLTAILAATDDKPAVRRRAVIALAPFEGPEVDAALQRALEDRDRQVRQAAEDLLDGG